MAKQKRSSSTPESTRGSDKELLAEMRAVKMLLVLLLGKLGSQSSEIAMALGISDSTLRNWISLRDVEKIPLPKA